MVTLDTNRKIIAAAVNVLIEQGATENENRGYDRTNFNNWHRAVLDSLAVPFLAVAGAFGKQSSMAF